MKRFAISLLTVLLFTTTLYAEQRIEEKGFIFTWKTEADRLIMTLSAETTGWVAFGIGGSSVMKGANIIMLWVDDEMGIAMAEDHYGSGKFKHSSDIDLGGSQDVQVLSGRQSENQTVVNFSIPLDSGDEFDTPLKRGEVYRLLLASNKSDKISWKHNRTYTDSIEIR